MKKNTQKRRFKIDPPAAPKNMTVIIVICVVLAILGALVGVWLGTDLFDGDKNLKKLKDGLLNKSDENPEETYEEDESDDESDDEE